MKLLILSLLPFLIMSCATPIDIPIRTDIDNVFIPPENIPTHVAGMTDISKIDPTIIIDLKYKTKENFTGKTIYPDSMRPLLRPKTAARLWYASKLLRENGYRLKVWDAYRPQDAQIVLWESSGKNPKFVADPYNQPSLHTHGVAVDLTIVNRDGSPVLMPTDFDDFSKRASPHAWHTNPIVRRNLFQLKRAMTSAGFLGIRSEWWHFLDRDYRQYNIIPSIP